MMNQTVAFEQLFALWTWKPIRNCPGRFTLAGGVSKLTPVEILGVDLPVFEFRVDAAPDAVWVVNFNDGGLISYRKSDGGFLHTLNNADGFARKLDQLGIRLEL